MPDVKDAIKVITDPANLIASDSHATERRVHEKRAVAALKRQGLSKPEARVLIGEAVKELGGHVKAEVRTSGRGAGPDTKKAAQVWLVPVSVIREVTWAEAKS